MGRVIRASTVASPVSGRVISSPPMSLTLSVATLWPNPVLSWKAGVWIVRQGKLWPESLNVCRWDRMARPGMGSPETA